MEHPILKRKANRKDNPLYGLNVRVARKLGKSPTLISVVRRGLVIEPDFHPCGPGTTHWILDCGLA